MAKHEAADSDDDGGEKKVGGKKKLIIIAAIVILLGGGVAAAYFLHLPPFAKSKTAEKSEEHAKEGEAKKDGEHGEGEKTAKVDPGAPVFLDLAPFLVNLNTAGATGSSRTSFLKMTVTIELANQDDLTKVQGVMPRVTDNFNTYLRELRPADLAGSAGLSRLREELLLRINKSAYPVQVKDILFKEMLVQ